MRIAIAGGTGTVGRHVIEAAREAGHDSLALSRSTGTDLITGRGLDGALVGADVVIDVANSPSVSAAKARDFFVTASRNLQAAAARQGVSRVITLSIVGIDRAADYGYYQAKLDQESAALEGQVPPAILRATQFHEFAGQILDRTHRGPVAAVPRMRIQPIAARAVAEALVATAAAPQPPPLAQIAGPEPADLVDLARRLLRRRGSRAVVVPLLIPGRAGTAMRNGSLLPTHGVPRVGPTFDQWLGG